MLGPGHGSGCLPACLVFIPPPRNALCFVLGAFPWLQGRDGGSKERSVCHAAVAAAVLFCSVAMPRGVTDSPGASASSWEMCFLTRRGSFELLFHPFPSFLLEKASRRGCMEAVGPRGFAWGVPNAEGAAAPGLSGWDYCLPAAVRVKGLSCSVTWLSFRRRGPCWLCP